MQMKFKTHNQKNIDIHGTCFVGNLVATYDELRNALGEPTVGDSYKTDAEWHVEFADGVVASIYNWKNGRNYCGADGHDVRSITEWNIGGADEKVATRVKIFMDLQREQHDADDDEQIDEVDAEFLGAIEILEMLRRVKGENYARTVEAGVIAQKLLYLVEAMLSTLVEVEATDSKSVKVARQFAMENLAYMVSVAAQNGKIVLKEADRVWGSTVDVEKQAAEFLDWVQKIVNRERAGAEKFVESLRGKK